MKTEKNILVAFILNITFSILEFVGGIFTGSIAIVSDAVHDMIDAISILISFILEKISKKKANDNYTYGYIRYSVLGALITTVMLICGSVFVIYESVKRIINPVTINYNGMIVFAIFGVIINFLAAYFTREGDSLNQKSVNLHMLEDVLGWIVVLIGSILMKFTNISLIDSIMSILVALFILYGCVGNMKNINDLFLLKAPKGIKFDEIKEHVLSIDGVKNIHHYHIWSIDGVNSFASLHAVIDKKNKNKDIKSLIKEELKEHGISHATVEIEYDGEVCDDKECHIEHKELGHHHH